jgi:hypothetical protein
MFHIEIFISAHLKPLRNIILLHGPAVILFVKVPKIVPEISSK